MKIYLACGLTHVPRTEFGRYVAFIHEVADGIQLLGAEVKYPLRHSDPQLATKPIGERARLCYDWDRAMVEWADLIVAECSYPSIGVGIELQVAEQCGVPIAIIFNSTSNSAPEVEYSNPDGSRHWLQIGEGHITLMALGLPNLIAASSYRGATDALEQISKVMTSVQEKGK